MMRAAFVLASALFITPVYAADHPLILTDDEINALRQVLDMAVKSNGMQIAPFAVYMNNKLTQAAASTVVEHKEPGAGDHIPDKPTEKRDGK